MKPINRNEPFVTENSEIFSAKDLSGRPLDFCIGVIAHGHDVVPTRPGGGLLFRQSSVYSPTEFWAQAGPAIVVDWAHTVSKLHEWFGDQWAECVASDLRLWLLRARVAVMFGDVFTAELAGICRVKAATVNAPLGRLPPSNRVDAGWRAVWAAWRPTCCVRRRSVAMRRLLPYRRLQLHQNGQRDVRLGREFNLYSGGAMSGQAPSKESCAQ